MVKRRIAFVTCLAGIGWLAIAYDLFVEPSHCEPNRWYYRGRVVDEAPGYCAGAIRFEGKRFYIDDIKPIEEIEI